jgi:uncharacterized membrane protein
MNDLVRATGLAALTGSRALVPRAIVARAAARPAPRRAAATLLAALEMVFDKLPRSPNRTAPLLLAGRLLFGAGVARAVLRRRGRAARAGAALLGGAVAGLSAFAGVRLRRALTTRLGGGALASAIAGALEDTAVIVLGTRLARG